MVPKNMIEVGHAWVGNFLQPYVHERPMIPQRWPCCWPYLSNRKTVSPTALQRRTRTKRASIMPPPEPTLQVHRDTAAGVGGGIVLDTSARTRAAAAAAAAGRRRRRGGGLAALPDRHPNVLTTTTPTLSRARPSLSSRKGRGGLATYGGGGGGNVGGGEAAAGAGIVAVAQEVLDADAERLDAELERRNVGSATKLREESRARLQHAQEQAARRFGAAQQLGEERSQRTERRIREAQQLVREEMEAEMARERREAEAVSAAAALRACLANWGGAGATELLRVWHYVRADRG
jgi:hypothetical protein